MPPTSDATLLRIYTEEGKQHAHRPLYEHIVLTARDLGVAGATVLRGPLGYGRSGVLHTTRIIDLSASLPLVIEMVDTPARIEALVDALEGVAGIGLITLETVRVVARPTP